MDDLTISASGLRLRPDRQREGFVRLDMDAGQLPVLALTLLGRAGEELNFAPGREWLRVVHQSGGLGCTQQELLITPLSPTESVAPKLLELAERYDESNLGLGVTALSELIAYQQTLHELLGEQVNCERSYRLLQEAVYPIDATPEAVAALCEDELPQDLDDLVNWQGSWDRLRGVFAPRWALVVLTENSD